MLSIKSLVASAVLAAAVVLAADNVDGGWSEASTEEVTKLYQTAAATKASYPSSDCPRVCATKFTKASKQVVAGMNYKLQVEGCAVTGEANTGAGCKCSGATSAYTINLFEPLGQAAPHITRIAASSEAGDAEPSGWLVGAFNKPKTPTDADKAAFFNATGTDANYASADLPRVCATDILTVSQQVVAGTNYVFSVKGCAVPKATSDGAANCATTCASSGAASFQVKLFQSLPSPDVKYQVTGVLKAKNDGTFLADNSTSDSPVITPSNSSTTTAAPKASAATTASVAIVSALVAAAALVQ